MWRRSSARHLWNYGCDIAIAKSANVTSSTPGGIIDYTIIATAHGPLASHGVVATDTLPSTLTFISATTSAGSYASSTGTWTIGDLAASSTATLTIAAKVNAGTANTTITNQATITESSAETDPNTGITRHTCRPRSSEPRTRDRGHCHR